MAIHYLQCNMDVEDIALDEIRDDPTYDDDSDLQTAETGFGGGTIDAAPVDTPLTLALQGQLKQTAIDDAYKIWGTPDGGAFPDKFEYTKEGGLRLSTHSDIRLTNTYNNEALALSTIARKIGVKAVRDELGFAEYIRPQKIDAAALQKINDAAALQKINDAAALQKVNDALAKAQAKIKSAPPQGLPAAASDAEEALKITPSGEPEQLSTREIRALDKALQTIRGELVNNLAKLTELDNHITREQNKLDEPDIGEFERRRIAERIRDLKDERVSRLEAASASREALRSQISRIRETINRLINEDTTLAERIRTLFREQGITIVSILTALGMVISTLVLAVGIGGASAAPPTPPSKAGLREWVKKYLHALGRVLAKLAAKAGAALPGIIGSVVGWLLNLLSKTAGWLASNLWALMLAVGSILLIAAREWLAKR